MKCGRNGCPGFKWISSVYTSTHSPACSILNQLIQQSHGFDYGVTGNIMRFLIVIFAVLLFSLSGPSDVLAQSDDLMKSYRQYQALYKAGKYREAIPHAKRVLELAEKEFGPSHETYAIFLNNLAGLYLAQGSYAQAEPLYRRSLAIAEKVLGPDHPNVGTALGDLAGLYQAQGRYGEAEPLLRRDLPILEKALGPNHPDVGTGLSNLALLYQAQGRYGKAKPLLRRDLAISEKTLGPDHPDVSTA